MSCCDPTELFTDFSINIPMPFTKKTSDCNIDTKSDESRKSSSCKPKCYKLPFQAIITLPIELYIAWRCLHVKSNENDNILAIRPLDQESISKALADAASDGFANLLLWTIIFATILCTLSICIVEKKWEMIKNLNGGTQKTKNMEQIAVKICFLSCLIAWIAAICLIPFDIKRYPIPHLMVEIIMVGSLTLFEISYSSLTVMKRFYERKEWKQSNHDNICKEGFYFFYGLFWFGIIIVIIIVIIVYTSKYWDLWHMIFDPEQTLPDKGDYLYEWIAFILTMIYFAAMSWTLFLNPIGIDTLKCIKNEYLKIFCCKCYTEESIQQKSGQKQMNQYRLEELLSFGDHILNFHVQCIMKRVQSMNTLNGNDISSIEFSQCSSTNISSSMHSGFDTANYGYSHRDNTDTDIDHLE